MADKPAENRAAVARAVVWSAAGEATSKGSVFVLNALALLVLAPVEFGQFVTLQAAGLLAVATWDLGMSSLTTREVAAGSLLPGALRREVVRFRLRSLAPAGLVYAFGVAASGLVGHAPDLALYLGAAYFLVYGSHMVLLAALRGLLRFRDASVAITAGRIVAVAMGGVALWITGEGSSVTLFMLALILGELTTLLAAGAWLLPHVRPLPTEQRRILTFRAAAPFAATSLLQVAYNRFDVILVAAVSSAAVVGAYAPASRLQDALYLIPSIASVVLYPYASKVFADRTVDMKAARRLWARMMAVVVLLAVAIAVLWDLVAPSVVPALFGTRYDGAILPTQIIVWSVPLIAFNSTLNSVLNARRLAHFVSIAIAFALVTVVVGDLLLVPWLGATGAALAATLREFPVAVTVVLAARHAGFFDGLRVLARGKAMALGSQPGGSR